MGGSPGGPVAMNLYKEAIGMVCKYTQRQISVNNYRTGRTVPCLQRAPLREMVLSVLDVLYSALLMGGRSETPGDHIGRAASQGQCGIDRVRTPRDRI